MAALGSALAGTCKVTRRTDGLTWTEVDNEIFVLDSNEGFYLHLNVTAAFLWEQLAEARSVDDLVAAAQSAFAGDPAEVRAGVIELLETLRGRKVVAIQD